MDIMYGSAWGDDESEDELFDFMLRIKNPFVVFNFAYLKILKDKVSISILITQILIHQAYSSCSLIVFIPSLRPT
jgi:hypothetical protein